MKVAIALCCTWAPLLSRVEPPALQTQLDDKARQDAEQANNMQGLMLQL